MGTAGWEDIYGGIRIEIRKAMEVEIDLGAGFKDELLGNAFFPSNRISACSYCG